jgi:hypothetical protein
VEEPSPATADEPVAATEQELATESEPDAEEAPAGSEDGDSTPEISDSNVSNNGAGPDALAAEDERAAISEQGAPGA